MNSKKRLEGIFVSFEGIGSTIFDSQVLLHAKILKNFNVNIDILSFETWPSRFKKSQERLKHIQNKNSINIALYRGLFFYIPFSSLINNLIVLFRLIAYKRKPQFLHARTEYSVASCYLYSRLYKVPIIWDCRGDTIAELRQAFNSKGWVFKLFFKNILIQSSKLNFSIARNICSRAIFVSSGLQKGYFYLKNKHEVYIIPSTASKYLFYFSLSLREEHREIMKFREDQIIIIYSGSIVGHQNFHKYIDYFEHIFKHNSNIHFLVITPDKSKAIQYLKPLPRLSYSIYTAGFSDMNGYYNIADYAILLRDNNNVNDIASPTKFFEYSLAGLPVITNNTVNQVKFLSKEIGNYVSDKKYIFREPLSSVDREKISTGAQKYSKEAMIPKYLQIYR